MLVRKERKKKYTSVKENSNTGLFEPPPPQIPGKSIYGFWAAFWSKVLPIGPNLMFE